MSEWHEDNWDECLDLKFFTAPLAAWATFQNILQNLAQTKLVENVRQK
jgi:hypothetical protein